MPPPIPPSASWPASTRACCLALLGMLSATAADDGASAIQSFLRTYCLECHSGKQISGDTDLGRLSPGARADLLVYDLWKPHLQPVRDPIKNLVWKGNAGDLALVMVHGEPVVRDGRHLKVDEAQIMRTAAVAARKIWNIAEERQILPAAT